MSSSGAPLRSSTPPRPSCSTLQHIRDSLSRRLERTLPGSSFWHRWQATTAVVMPAMAHVHPQGLLAFLHPLQASGRKEYQLWVRLLHSAAMLSGRWPVLPLAHCSERGEWAETSRCVFVVQSVAPHSGKAGRYCGQRPPSVCYGRIAMPAEVEGVPEEQRATLRLGALQEADDGPDSLAFARQLNAPSLLSRRLLLLDTSRLDTPDALRSLFVSPKGWLCTLEHKSCQAAC